MHTVTVSTTQPDLEMIKTPLSLVIAAVIFGAGCRPQQTALWIVPGSSAAHLVLGIAKTRGGEPVDQFGVLRVHPCNGPQSGPGAMWVLTQQVDEPAVTRVTYGEVPAGYTSQQGPLPLNPGCY